MNRKYFKLYSIAIVALFLMMGSCTKDLNTIPIDDDSVTAATVYDSFDAHKQILAKLYAGLAVSGQEGPAGLPDISGIDEGFSQYLRQYWIAQELTTDEAICAWNDGNLRDYHDQDWSSTNEFVTAMYNRIYYQISLCNEFIRETTPEKIAGRNLTEQEKDEVSMFAAEARFLRAFSYWHALDMFGSVPFVTEEDEVGSTLPEQISKTDLFTYLETELTEIATLMAEPLANEYGRVDKAAAWMLLAKLYLNAEVYIGEAKYTEALTALNQVLTSGYILHDNYEELFLADNHTADGIIFPVTYDGMNTRTYGGMTFILHAMVGGNMDPAEYGIDGGWAGNRTTSAFYKLFYPGAAEPLAFASHAETKNGYPVLYVPGDHQGWNPSVAPQVASVNDDGNYEGYVNLTTGGFKFTTAPDWSDDWGEGAVAGTLEHPGGNIVAPEAGYYKLNVDFNAKTFTMQKTEWGVIGSATADGWSSDQNMTYDPVTDTWEVILDLVAGEIKFRANDGWDLNYGDNSPADGILEQGSPNNIPIAEAGTYKITLKLGKPDYTYTIVRESWDRRGVFHTDGQNMEIGDIFEFTDGYAIGKFKNLTSSGVQGSDNYYPDNDWIVFRLADAYLMYAEAVLRGGTGGNLNTALDYINELRERAYGDDTGNIDIGELTLDFILDERGRELYWEGHRRTDLVRFGQFSNGTYIWPWKGGVADGITVDSRFDLFPIPATDLAANPNLTQNPNYTN